MYGINPLTPIDLITLPTDCKVSFEVEKRAKEMKRLHDRLEHTLRKSMKLTKLKPTRIGRSLSFNLGALFGCTSGRRGSLLEGRVS